MQTDPRRHAHSRLLLIAIARPLAVSALVLASAAPLHPVRVHTWSAPALALAVVAPCLA